MAILVRTKRMADPFAIEGIALFHLRQSAAGLLLLLAMDDSPDILGDDPHEDPRATAAARKQKAAFLTTGRIVDVCDGAPCLADPR